MMPSEKNTKRVILALDQAYNKFVQLEDKSTDEAEICAYRCYYTNVYESKLYVEQMQAEIDRLKNDKANVIKLLEKEREENKPGSDYVIRPMRASDINEQHKGMYYAFSFAINALKDKDGEQE